jgi:hypothetical protein
MDAVIKAEQALGHQVLDVSAQKCGWDITSQPPAIPGCPLPEPRHIEVKGRIQGSDTITVTSNEIMYGLNQREKFLLAIVLVEGEQARRPVLHSLPVYAGARLGNHQRQPQPEIFAFTGRTRVSELIPHGIKQEHRRQESAQAH